MSPVPGERPMLSLEQKTITIQFQPSDDFLAACTALRDNPHFQVIVQELSVRWTHLASAACHVNDETISRWIAGRVQELQEVTLVCRETKRILEAKQGVHDRAAQARQAM